MNKLLYHLAIFLLPVASAIAQDQMTITPDGVTPMIFHGETMAYRDWDPSRTFPDKVVRDIHGVIGEREEEEAIEGRRLHAKVDPGALPLGVDPAWQTVPASRPTRALDLTQNGQGNTGVAPSDNCLDVGPNHVIQMINGSSGARFQIFNKAGASLGAAAYLDNFSGLGDGLGDPIVLYDALADRWLMSEFSASSNALMVAISTTADPTGTWYTYTYSTSQFPDYPKYSVWNNTYLVTSNESDPAIYALPRANMLAGTAGSVVRFTVSSYGSIGFQAVTPVTFDGGTAPPTGALPMFMRMADDGWGAPADRLEIWTLNYNATTPASSSITGPTSLNTLPFETELCGYLSFSCIDQPGSSTNLDPLREVLMNRIQYRNFGTHESIVCNHVTDVNGSDRAGIRWYELRRTGGSGNPWSIYQQGTYSPDANSRWMGGIAINANGDIGLAYNIAGTNGGNVYPSVRYTGRYASDPLGQMTFAETSIVAGTNASNTNRYGDYNSLDVDPANGTTFWGTAQYNPASSWSTRMFAFSFPAQTLSVGVKVKLDGPYVAGTGLMYDSLRVKGFLPPGEPYTALGYTFVGGGGEAAAGSVFSTSGNNAIVDWVIVELRSSTNNTTVLASKAGLLQRDGDVVGVDGVTPLAFNLPSASYYVAVRHRNHLGIMTASTVALSGSLVTIDLTQAATATYGTEGRKDVGGTQLMWAGNTFRDVPAPNKLIYTNSGNDREPILLEIGGIVPTNTTTGYKAEDTNLDGRVKYTGAVNDRDVILQNIGGLVPTNTRTEQMP